MRQSWLYDEVIEQSVSGKLLTNDGRLVKNPTFNLISEQIKDIKTVLYWENGQVVKRFLQHTKLKELNLIVLMGFSPKIYLKPYHPEMDLWKYPKRKT